MRLEKNRLLLLLRSLQFHAHPDSIFWHLEKSSFFTVQSLYKFLNSGGVHIRLTISVWILKIPLKVKLFLWLAIKNRILTKDNLIKRGWHGSILVHSALLMNLLITYFLHALLLMFCGSSY
jgi:zinc-binding in reverse transcriptase